MNTKFIVPEWLRDVFLGYGNPNATQNIEQMKTLDFVDTFLDAEHVKSSFPGQVRHLFHLQPSRLGLIFFAGG